MSSAFDKFAKRAEAVSQRFFGETASYKSGSTTKSVKAVFFKEWVETNGVSTYEMLCEVSKRDIAAPKRGDEITRGAIVFKVAVVQETEGEIVRLVVKEKSA